MGGFSVGYGKIILIDGFSFSGLVTCFSFGFVLFLRYLWVYKFVGVDYVGLCSIMKSIILWLMLYQ